MINVPLLVTGIVALVPMASLNKVSVWPFSIVRVPGPFNVVLLRDRATACAERLTPELKLAVPPLVVRALRVMGVLKLLVTELSTRVPAPLIAPLVHVLPFTVQVRPVGTNTVPVLVKVVAE